LDELFNELKVEEGVLAGGQKLGVGAETVKALRESAVSYGDPRSELIQLTPETLEELDVELGPIEMKQMAVQYDFYHLALSVSLYPKQGNIFKRIENRLDFRGKEDSFVIVQSLFPEPRYRKVLEWGGRLNLGLNGKLSWDIGVDAERLPELQKIGIPTAELKTNDEIGSSIVVPDFSFNMGRAEIAAAGAGNDHCLWRIETPELKESQTVRFVIIFKVPKGTERIELEGRFICEPDMELLTTNVEHVFGELKDKFKAIFRKLDKDREGPERLPIGAHELWAPLLLPRRED
jgi:hypothetical protein